MEPQQIIDVRLDIGDSESAFSDDEIIRLFERAGNQYEKTVLMAIDQLLSNATKFNDYSANQTDEKKSQVFDHLIQLRDVWQDKVDAIAKKGKGVRMVLIASPRSRPERPSN